MTEVIRFVGGPAHGKTWAVPGEPLDAYRFVTAPPLPAAMLSSREPLITAQVLYTVRFVNHVPARNALGELLYDYSEPVTSKTARCTECRHIHPACIEPIPGDDLWMCGYCVTSSYENDPYGDYTKER